MSHYFATERGMFEFPDFTCLQDEFPKNNETVEASETRGTTALVYLQALYMYCPVLLEYTRLV
jgi:hypothetical protein